MSKILGLPTPSIHVARLLEYSKEQGNIRPKKKYIAGRGTAIDSRSKHLAMSMAAKAEAEEEEGVFSVWAVAAPEQRQGIREVMSKLRNEFGGPSFEPHVTVVGAQRMSQAEARSRLEAACKTVTPYTCSLTQVECGTYFYQCVYVLVDPTPQVMQANLQASRCFGTVDNPRPYMPHLSLLYGDLPEEDKQKAKIKAESFNHLLCNTKFEVSSLWLYKTDTQDKSLQSWEKVAECNLRDCTESEN